MTLNFQLITKPLDDVDESLIRRLKALHCEHSFLKHGIGLFEHCQREFYEAFKAINHEQVYDS
jgi:hypothetical protein